MAPPPSSSAVSFEPIARAAGAAGLAVTVDAAVAGAGVAAGAGAGVAKGGGAGVADALALGGAVDAVAVGGTCVVRTLLRAVNLVPAATCLEIVRAALGLATAVAALSGVAAVVVVVLSAGTGAA